MLIVLLTIPAVFSQEEGDQAPDFSFQDTNGQTFTLSDHRGKVVFMFLFGNTCPSCLGFGKQTETKVNQVYGDNENFVAVGLDLWNSSSSVTSVRSFGESTEITYPLLIQAGSVADLYSTTYDRLIVVDQDGIIRFKGKSLARNDLDDAIDVIDQYLMFTSNEDFNAQNDRIIDVYPNPADNFVTIRFGLTEGKTVSLSVWNSLGQETGLNYEEYLGAGEHQVSLNVSELENGLYFYRLDSESNQGITGRILVKR
jgi:peroxiredoxin